VADEKARSQANKENLSNGSTTLSDVYSAEGKDFEDVLPVMASDYGVTPDEMRAHLLATNLAGAAQHEPMQPAAETEEEPEDVDESAEAEA
jgi:hypothetical protein